jgi:Methyltransferase domain
LEQVRDRPQLVKHLHQAIARLPGTAYYEVLGWVHKTLEPDNYLEIGVHQGRSLEEAGGETRCIGIDPEPDIDRDLPPTVAIYELTSDDFFDRHDPHELLGGPVELAFIDGLHLFEQVLRDFVNVERSSAPDGVIVLHDCLPLDEVTSARERTTDFYAGDVWKATLALRRRRPDLATVIVRTPPTGLCLVTGLDSDNRDLERALPAIEAEYRGLGFDYYLDHRDEMPPEIPNDEDAVREWLSEPSSRSRRR